MLNIGLGEFKYNTKDVVRNNSIFISLPYNKLIINVNLKFNKISEINFYYEQIFQIIKLLKINFDLSIIDRYDDALKKIDRETKIYDSNINISRSLFGKLNKKMFGVGYSIKKEDVLNNKLDMLMIKIFNNIGDTEWIKNNL